MRELLTEPNVIHVTDVEHGLPWQCAFLYFLLVFIGEVAVVMDRYV